MFLVDPSKFPKMLFNKFARFPGYTLYQEISLNYSWLLPICQEHADKARFEMIPYRGIHIDFLKREGCGVWGRAFVGTNLS